MIHSQHDRVFMRQPRDARPGGRPSGDTRRYLQTLRAMEVDAAAAST